MPAERVEDRVLRTARLWPRRPAVEGEGQVWSYARLVEEAMAVGAALPPLRGPEPARVGLLARRGPLAFAGILGVLWRGRTVVPFSPGDPPRRLAELAVQAGVQTLLVDEVHRGLAEAAAVASPCRPAWEVVSLEGRAPQGGASPDPRREDLAQVLFTSGSTGRPRAVPIRHDSLRAFLEAVAGRWDLGPEDRFSQNFDLAFDLHGFDLFLAWELGACVVVPPSGTALLAVRGIKEAGLTAWFSTPSVGELARRLGTLRPGALPGLRWVGSCGEPLACTLAEAWAAAAPGARVVNLYGPTEMTIACAAFEWRPGACVDGLVPLGEPLAGVELAVVDGWGRPVPDGDIGELVATGRQRASCYLGDPGATSEAFVALPGRPGIWYRTGDRVRRDRQGGPLCFVGRTDAQVQVRGHRVELGAVEAALRAVPGVEEVVVLPWPRDGARVEGLVAFFVGSASPRILQEAVEARLPGGHRPRRWERLDRLPLTARGKVDHAALVALLAAGGER